MFNALGSRLEDMVADAQKDQDHKFNLLIEKLDSIIKLLKKTLKEDK